MPTVINNIYNMYSSVHIYTICLDDTIMPIACYHTIAFLRLLYYPDHFPYFSSWKRKFFFFLFCYFCLEKGKIIGRQRVMHFNRCSLQAYMLQELCCVWSPVGGQPEKLVMSPLLFTRHLTFCWSGRLCDGWIRPVSFLTRLVLTLTLPPIGWIFFLPSFSFSFFFFCK